MSATVFNSVQDSGQREKFEGGAVRDVQDNKPRYALIPPGPLFRLAMHYTNGAKKYDDHNWVKGMPISRCVDSLMRHIEAYRVGDTTEDHLAAIAWNAFAIMFFEDNRPELDDMDTFRPNVDLSLNEDQLKLSRQCGCNGNCNE